jgi:hypothetical protein
MTLETDDEIVSFIEARTQHNWQERKEPLLLSLLGSEMLVINPNYRDVFAPMAFRQFLSSKTAGKLQIVQHPNQKAKIGLIPREEIFTFPENSETIQEINPAFVDKKYSSKRRVQGKYIVQNFLDLLSDLDSEDVSRVSIPIDVIAKMIKSR